MIKSQEITPWWEAHIDAAFWPVVCIALSVGKFQAEHFRNHPLSLETKTTTADLVTEIDKASDQRIVTALQQLFPEDAILSEEGGLTVSAPGRLWIVDPLDGTTNYASGLPIFAVSIALWQDGTPIFGVVYTPMVGDLAVGERGKGAYLNNRRCSLSQKSDLSQCVLGTGFPYDRRTARNCNAENAARIIPKVRGIRRMGAAAYDLTLVAAGHLDAFWELRLSIWDIAAAKLFLLEAGATYHERIDKGLHTIVVGNASLVNQIEALTDLEN